MLERSADLFELLFSTFHHVQSFDFSHNAWSLGQPTHTTVTAFNLYRLPALRKLYMCPFARGTVREQRQLDTRPSQSRSYAFNHFALQLAEALVALDISLMRAADARVFLRFLVLIPGLEQLTIRVNSRFAALSLGGASRFPNPTCRSSNCSWQVKRHRDNEPLLRTLNGNESRL